jgi:hypothetical protein
MKIGAIRAQAACAGVQVRVHVQVHVRAGTGEAVFRIDIWQISSYGLFLNRRLTQPGIAGTKKWVKRRWSGY